MVTEDKSCKSSVKTKQKEREEWQLVLPIKKKKVNHSAIQKGYEKPLESENRHGCSNLLEL